MKDFGVAMEAINNFYGLTTHKTTSLAGFDLSSSSKNLITNHKHLDTWLYETQYFVEKFCFCEQC